MKNITLALALLCASVAAPAAADTLILNGSIADTDPTFNAPSVGAPPTRLSGGGATPYDSFAFNVSAGGRYSFVMASRSPGLDTLLGLYANRFDPAAPLTNAVVYNDGGGLPNSKLDNVLSAGTNYFAVLTANRDFDRGDYTFNITGPGVITTGGIVAAVPEPASWAMMILGVGAIGGSLRRRRNREVSIGAAFA